MEQHVVSAALPMLILGLGWTGQFLAELLVSLQLNYAATTRDGRNNTIQWSMPSVCQDIDVSSLPFAKTVLVTFPVMQPECMSALMDAYETKHQAKTQWILLSSTRPFNSNPADRHTPLDRSKDTGRMGAEDVVIKHGGSVLHLAGLWGGQRQPKNWVPRFPTQEAIRNKLLARQLHLIHGKDVARSIVAVHDQFKPGERWIVTDNGCYDWIKLFLVWGSEEQIAIARDLAAHDETCHQALGSGSLEEIVARGGVKPRLDSSEFWETFGLNATKYLTIE
ncbi:uncharacterized protein B0P05DRAFT_573542 [Gilbertella persicaria]|uniref:NAD(P)-binding domain-containing protein n=1 Tax=Rhizopus stolonifer TaxID=4846 RepID=A0A367K0G2_RHIST|nr:uncharacterized protein B0P05DRAFT_573542 [Gilbertella persicaria]KAI8069077.1 hypothetical protein B0P05DRAFT_573542 [Gilbertella persicaria]RCH95732.1 hypothetical protein CU098_009357 [Rhizopus stolonifer]